MSVRRPPKLFIKYFPLRSSIEEILCTLIRIFTTGTLLKEVIWVFEPGGEAVVSNSFNRTTNLQAVSRPQKNRTFENVEPTALVYSVGS